MPRARLTAKDGNTTGIWYDYIDNVTVANATGHGFPRGSINDLTTMMPGAAATSRALVPAPGSALRRLTRFDKKPISVGPHHRRLSVYATNVSTHGLRRPFDPRDRLTPRPAPTCSTWTTARYPMPTRHLHPESVLSKLPNNRSIMNSKISKYAAPRYGSMGFMASCSALLGPTWEDNYNTENYYTSDDACVSGVCTTSTTAAGTTCSARFI
jgi:hypothetical protein